MNTSGVADPPEISVASVARLVSVLVGADTRFTWMFGYAFSNALISTVRVSVAPAPAIGLADHWIVPEVVDPVADCVAAGAPELLVVLLLLLQAPRVSAVTPARATSPRPPLGQAGNLLSELLRDISAPPGLCPVMRGPMRAGRV